MSGSYVAKFYVYGFTCMSDFIRQVQHVWLGIRDTYAERT